MGLLGPKCFVSTPPPIFEEAVDIALNAEFNFKAARYGTHGHAQSSFDRTESMDLSHVDDGEAEL